MVTRPPRLFLRVIVAIIVIVSFYSFALAIAGGMFFISYISFSWARSGILFAKIGLPCIATGAIILWSVIPRVDRFTPPGLHLNPTKHPKIFKEIEAIAELTQQATPKEVYLIPEINAWVAERGGCMGIGSRRVMGIGLPLLQTLTVSEFRAVLAHEFGHYYGGDTKLTPWIYKTRIAIARTLQSLDKGLIHIVFQLYGKLFLRITHAISRYQEYVADEVAARIESSQSLAAGLRKIHAAGFAYNAYWRSEFLPVLNAGYFPPYVKGFEYFMQKGNIKNAMDTSIEEELAAAVSSPYDTHPPLRERLKVLENYPIAQSIEETPAITLLEAVPDLEKELFIAIGGDEGRNLATTNWDNVGEVVYLPMWNNMAKRYKSLFVGMTLEDIPEIAKAPREFIRKIELIDNRQLPVESGYLYARQILGVAISVKLASQGWKVIALPGEAIKLTKQQDEFEPFKTVTDLFEKNLTIQEWRGICQCIGIYEMNLELDIV